MSTLSKAIQNLEEQKRRIDDALKVLYNLDQGGDSGAPPRRNISPAGRRRIVAAQKRRWARVRAAKKKK